MGDLSSAVKDLNFTAPCFESSLGKEIECDVYAVESNDVIPRRQRRTRAELEA